MSKGFDRVPDRQATGVTLASGTQKKVVAAAVIGNLLEFYDFTVYSYFALTIGRLCFPSHDPITSTLLSFAAFAVGFVARPVGGFVLGRYANKNGRKQALSLTILLMAIGSLVIGLVPTYEQVGLASPLLVVLARLVQGFAQGGEFGPATAMLLETGSSKSRAYRASFQLASQGAAALMGSGIAAGLGFLLSDETMQSWGWRVPFLLGILIAPVGIYLRKHIEEEPLNAVVTNLFDHRERATAIRNWFLTVFSIMGMTVSSYVMLYYLPSYCVQYLGMPANLSLLSGVVASAINTVACPLIGLWSDRLGRRKPLIYVGRISLVVSLYPAFWLMTHFQNLGVVLGATSVLVLLYSLASTPSYALMPENFPKHLRAGFLSSSYAVAVAVFGGTAQLVATWLIEVSGNKLAPAWYMIAMVVLSLVAVSRFRETGAERLDSQPADGV